MYSVKKLFSGNNLKQSAKRLQPSLRYEETTLAKQAYELEQSIGQYKQLLAKIDSYDNTIKVFKMLEAGDIALSEENIAGLSHALHERNVLVNKASNLKNELAQNFHMHRTEVLEATNLINSKESVALVAKQKNKEDFNTMVEYAIHHRQKLQTVEQSYNETQSR